MKVVHSDKAESFRIEAKNSVMAEKLFGSYKNAGSLKDCRLDGLGFKKELKGAFYNVGKTLKEAEAGNSDAMLELGVMFENGIFFRKNVEKAFKWYEKGARSGNDFCQLALFYLYKNTSANDHNMHKAVFWLKQSAENGNAAAMYILGQLYLEGILEEPAAETGLECLKRSAKAGCLEAMLYLGCAHEKGVFMSADKSQAYKWYLKASELDSGEACVQLAQLVFKEFCDNEKYVKTAVRFLERSVKCDNSEAAFLLGGYYKSLGEQYYEKAFSFLKKSADTGDNALAALEVAEMYETGCGVAANAEKADKYYMKVLDLV